MASGTAVTVEDHVTSSRTIVGASAAQVMLVGSVQRVQSLTFEPLHALPNSLAETMARGESVDHATADVHSPQRPQHTYIPLTQRATALKDAKTLAAKKITSFDPDCTL